VKPNIGGLFLSLASVALKANDPSRRNCAWLSGKNTFFRVLYGQLNHAATFESLQEEPQRARFECFD
jgi:hypothetical protein